MFGNLFKENGLNINCGIACLIEDREGMLDKYSTINLNCGTYIASEAVNAKLVEKEANINSGQMIIIDYKGEFVLISDGAVIDEGADYSGKYVIGQGNIFLRGEGWRAFENVVGAVVSGTLYYPSSSQQSALARVKGNMREYPDGAFVLLGNQDLKKLLAKTPEDAKSVWVAGEVSALDETALQKAKERNLVITCDRLFSYEGLFETFGSLFHAADCTLIPDGFTVTGPLTLNEAAVLYGKKLYVRGALLLDEKSARCLSQFESILVKGRASLPTSCVSAFQAVGKADSYWLYEGQLYNINGWETFSHERLNTMVGRGEKMTLQINGFAIFDEDVTAEDMDAIASLSCNGFIIMPGAAQGAISSRMGTMNGFITDMASIEKMTGLTVEEATQKLIANNSVDGSINTAVYTML